MAKTALFAEKKQNICPECGSVLVIRSGRHGPFLGCSRYPQCGFIRPLKIQADGHIVKVLDGQICPQCQATLVLRQGRYGMFIGCDNYPECNHTQAIDRPDETTIDCPQCKRGTLLQRKSRYGKVFHSCDCYPDCQFTLNHKPVAGECIYCHYPLLLEKKTAQGIRFFVPANYAESRQRLKLITMSDVSDDVLVPLLRELQNESVIAYPTEAVFGLGCDPDSEIAVKRLLALKQRPWQKGLILIAANYQQLSSYVDDSALSEKRKYDMFSSWPGPVTWVMPAKPTTPKWLTGQFTSLAVRVSAHPLVKQLCLSYGKPLVSTSANLSGLPPCRTEEEVCQQFGKDFPIVHGKVGGRTNPSEIRDVLTGELLRQG